MNSSTRGDRYFHREDFEPPRRRLPRPVLIAVLMVLATVTHYIAFLAGAAMKASECRQALAMATAGRPTCNVLAPASTALTQWKCTDQEFREHIGACVARGEAPRWWHQYIKPPKE